MRYAAALLLLFAGCLPTDPAAVPSFVPALSVLCGVASTVSAEPVTPDDTGVCLSCGGQGWLGDGTIKMDCPDCNTPWRSTPPEVTTPRREVIQSPAPQPVVEEAAGPGTPAPPEEERLNARLDRLIEDGIAEESELLGMIDQHTARTLEGGRMYYTNFRSAGEVAADTERPLMLLVDVAGLPDDFEPPSGVTCCVVPHPPAGFHLEWLPCAMLFGQVTHDGHSEPILLDPKHLQASLAQALEML